MMWTLKRVKLIVTESRMAITTFWGVREKGDIDQMVQTFQL